MDFEEVQGTRREPEDGFELEDAVVAGASIEKALCAARELLSMEIAWVAEFRAGKKIFRALEGDGRSFGFSEGDEMPLDCSYCQRVVAGVAPNVIPDTASEPAVCDLDVTLSSRIGAYAGVPIELGDGTVYGTLCVASHGPRGDLDARDAEFLRGVARRVAGMLEELRLGPVDGASRHAGT